MRTIMAVIATIALLVSGASLATASSRQSGSGLLLGLTQISYGCPGPARIGQPTCESWHRFQQTRFGIQQIGPKGQPLPQFIRVVVSDRQGRFSVRLSTGDYEVMPLVQAHTSGGPKLTVKIRSRHTTRIQVRFFGVPRMV